MVRWRASILSLGSGDGIPVLVGKIEVYQKLQNLYNIIQYMAQTSKQNKADPCVILAFSNILIVDRYIRYRFLE